MYSLEEVRAVDPEIADSIVREEERQNSHIELIASENTAIKGEELNEELLDSGYLAALPDTYREIKDNLVARFRRKLAKERRSGANQEG